MDPDEAKTLLEKVSICIVATSTNEGLPWATPLFYNYTPDLRFVWESEKDAHHSELLQTNEHIAIVVADFASSPTQSLYFEASAREVPPDALDEAIETFWHGPHKTRDRTPLTAADYQGSNPLRLYEALPTRCYTLTQTKVESGHTVERRIEIPLPLE